MEIIMKVKCSPNSCGGSPSHPSLKIVDQQQTNFKRKNATSPQIPPYSIPPSTSSSDCPASTISCAECNVGYCCNLPACCITSPTSTSQHLPTPPPLMPLHSSPMYASSNSNPQPSEDQPPEFVSIDDEKVKEYLMKFGQQQLEQQRKQQQQQQEQQQQQNKQTLQSQQEQQRKQQQKQQEQQHQQQKQHTQQQTHQFQHEQYRPQQHQQHQYEQKQHHQSKSKVTHVLSIPSVFEERSRPVVYEIIELDDESEREKLKQIKMQAEQRLAAKKSTPCIDINYAARHTKSLNISLIPKNPDHVSTNLKDEPCQEIAPVKDSRTKNKSAQHKIIAEISLIDSSDEEEYSKENEAPYHDDDEDDDLPLVAVSCELQCDDDDEDDEVVEEAFVQNPSFSNLQLSRPRSIASLKSAGEIKSGLGSEENNEDLLVRWEECEGQRERIFFECFLCGKKVQSSYNLRRHMMIHTGERPFACDMCDRRFREFSDLKKHRRRHSNEPNFKCMICRKNTPLENDSTRCINCCSHSKNAVLEAGMKINEEKNAAADMEMQEMDLEATDTSDLPQQPTVLSKTTKSAIYATNSPPLRYGSTPPLSSSSKSPHGEANVSMHAIPPPKCASPKDTQRFLDNIPAVHRPGYNQLGMITRKEFPCPLCNRAFGTRHNLKRHYMIHTGEKPFSCTKCRKPFREYSTLKKHMVTHQRDRWYKCIQCPMKYRDFLKYTDHKKSHANTEGDSDEQSYSEGPSSKSSNRYQSAVGDLDYMDSNEDDSYSDDWLECCECDCRFNDIDAYNEHVKEHETGAYQCCICDDEFQTNQELEKHLSIKHGKEAAADENII